MLISKQAGVEFFECEPNWHELLELNLGTPSERDVPGDPIDFLLSAGLTTLKM